MATKIKLGSNGNWGVKPNGVLAYNDENNVFKAIELRSSRASGATYVGEDGLIKDAEVGVPRIDWTNGVGELLLEPQSTNLITYSEEFDNVAWVKAKAGTGIAPVVTANQGLSPDGSVNADRVQFDCTDVSSASNRSFLIEGVTISSGLDYTFSFYLKAFDPSQVGLELRVIAEQITSSSIITIPAEWTRFEFTGTSTATITNLIIETRGQNTSNATADVLIFGAQLEQSSYPTSYIRTSGSAVTRIADAVTGNSSLGQVINSSEGVFYAEMSWFEDTPSVLQRISISDGTISQRVLLYKSTSANTISCIVTSGTGVLSVNYDYSVLSKSAGDTFKLAIKWKENDFAFWVDGNEVGSSSSGSSPVGLSELAFEGASNSDEYYGRIRDLRVYDTALTDAELQSLTS